MQAFNYKNITTNATTTVKSGQGMLHMITINKTANGTITVYDNTTAGAPIIATIDVSPVIGSTFVYDVAFTTGLTIVNAATGDITVSYS
jgi:hypothetical protein